MKGLLQVCLITAIVIIVGISILKSCGYYDFSKTGKSLPLFSVDTSYVNSTIRTISGCEEIQMKGYWTQAFDSLPETTLIVELLKVKKETVDNGKDKRLAKQIASAIRSSLRDTQQYNLYCIWIPVSTKHWHGTSEYIYGDNIPNDSLESK